MKEYLNDITHQLMEPEIALHHFHREVFNHFGVQTNPNHPLLKKIQTRNQQVQPFHPNSLPPSPSLIKSPQEVGTA